MTNFEKAVKMVVDDVKETLNTMYDGYEPEDWDDLLNIFGQESKDFKEDCYYILKEEDFITDDVEIIDGMKIYSYRQLSNAIRKALFK